MLVLKISIKIIVYEAKKYKTSGHLPPHFIPLVLVSTSDILSLNTDMCVYKFVLGRDINVKAQKQLLSRGSTSTLTDVLKVSKHLKIDIKFHRNSMILL